MMKKFLIVLDRFSFGRGIEAKSPAHACEVLKLTVKSNDKGEVYGHFPMGFDHERIYFLEFPSIEFPMISSREEFDAIFAARDLLGW